MAKVEHVKAARKDQGVCGRCGKEIKRGDAYQHASPGFRGPKLIRCLEFACRFRPSDLTTSKMAQVYAAQEAAHDALDALGTDFIEVDDVTSILGTLADEVRDVAQEYTDAADAMGPAGEEMTEKADAIESYADEVESTTFDDPPEEPEEAQSEDEVEEHAQEWVAWCEGVIDAAREAIDAFDY